MSVWFGNTETVLLYRQRCGFVFKHCVVICAINRVGRRDYNCRYGGHCRFVTVRFVLDHTNRTQSDDCRIVTVAKPHC